MIYNEYYRDENLQPEVTANSSVLIRNWEKDYFTSSLPWQQRGIAPALPISGITHAVWADSVFSSAAGNTAVQTNNFGGDQKIYLGNGASQANFKAVLNSNTVDLSGATTFNVVDLRLAFQIQKWMERNARAGARYTESLQAHFGVSPRDERLQRPEYIEARKLR